jgi:hypothetical protein
VTIQLGQAPFLPYAYVTLPASFANLTETLIEEYATEMSERMEWGGELPSQKTCWALLERIAESSQLKRSARLQSLLFYVGKRSIREGSDEIHEQEIGVEVYGRPAGYDTNVDNIVRVNASELRKRLAAYFETEGSHEPLIMEIPRGGYVPVFRYRAIETPTEPTPESLETPLSVALAPPPLEAPHAELPFPQTAQPPVIPIAAVLAGVVIAVLAIACATLWISNRSLNRTLHPWRSSPLSAEVWGPFVDGNRDTDIVMEDSSFLLVQNIDGRTYSFNDYLRRSYLDSQHSSQLSPQIREIKDGIAGKTLARAAEVRLVQKILSMDLAGKNLHIYNAREYTPALFTRDNVILLGNPTSNPWFALFEDHLNFLEQPESQTESVIFNRSPHTHEESTYTPTKDIAYGVVAYLPKSDQTGILLIQGSSSEATEACGNFILSENQLTSFSKLLGNTKLSYFELLLKVSHVTGTPITTTVEAYRAYPK